MSCKYTPNVAELLPVRQYRCEHCTDQVFGNQSHYQLHMRRRHKSMNENHKTPTACTYHCPMDDCIYHAKRLEGRGFKSLRFLRQHYQRMHMVKMHKCSECSETFLLPQHLERHRCCPVYECSVCGLTYTSKASLQTHMRRKEHLESADIDTTDKIVTSLLQKVALPSLKLWKKSQKSLKPSANPIQTSDTEDLLATTTGMQTIAYYVPTIEMPYSPIPAKENNVDTKSAIHSSVDENAEKTMPSNENELVIPSFTDEEVERLLRDMETQTDDVDLDALEINEVPLRNIQTQTLDNRQHQGTMTELDLETELGAQEDVTGTSSDYRHYQEPEPMFGSQASTHMHTQTCDELFEELGLSHIQTQTYWPDDGLHITQHTQTCDEMLDELLENFQSTCTQTRWMDWQEAENTSD